MPSDPAPRAIDRQEVRVVAMDGQELGATLFASPNPKGAVVLAGAMAVHQRIYGPLAQYLAEEGLAALTFDYRGTGRSRTAPLRRTRATLREWGEQDLASALSWMKARHAALPLYLLAHSVGGPMFGLVTGAPVERALFISCGSAWWGHYRGWRRWGLRLLWNLGVPGLCKLLGFFPMSLNGGEDLPTGVALEWARWARHPGYVASSPGALQRGFSTYAGPLTAWSITDDRYAPEPAVLAVTRLFSHARVRQLRWDPHALGVGRIGHFGLFRARFRENLWPKLRDALLQDSAPG